MSNKSLILLRELIKRTGSKIVISSSWRKSDKLLELFYDKCREVGFDLEEFVIGKTASYLHFHRGKEIKSFIDKSEQTIEKFLILDDEDFDILDSFNEGSFLKTNGEEGFDYGDFKKALDILT